MTRSELVSVRFSAEELVLVRERARALGLTMSGLIRQEALAYVAGFKALWWERVA